jgi:hypothetical protein
LSLTGLCNYAAGQRKALQRIHSERGRALVEVGVGCGRIERLRVPGVVLHLLCALVVALVLLQLHDTKKMLEATCARAAQHHETQLDTAKTAVTTATTDRQGGGTVPTSWLPLVVLCVHCTQIEAE